MSRIRHIKQLVFFCIILILVLVMIFSGLRILESTVFHKPEQVDTYVSRTVTRDGVDYYPRQDMKVMMVLGIDEFGPVKDSGSYNNTGEADMIALLIFDEKNEKCDVICLNRDTMLEMPVLGIGGKQAGTKFGQLALAHTYGSGLEDSCENTRKAVSDFLYGLTVDYYVSLNMDAITILNDAVGGVTVNVTEDFSDVDPTITMGEMTLMGEQALNYVRVRKDVGDQKNISRMKRQEEYIQNFLTAFKIAAEDELFVLETYDAVSPYIVTDCSAKALTGMISRYAEYTLNEIVSPEGENVMATQYYEFYADEKKLDEMILRLLYAPKN
ncbi:MAG: LCP family protein [Oscillospiraceae bacterium]|nr:LCP family protein [Oscillospiraceae bacterium]